MPIEQRWRFAAFYACYYAALGAYTPYIGRWVDSEGFGGYVVGAMLALWYGTRVISPPLWALAVTRSARPGGWLVAGCALTLLAFAGFAFTHTALALLLVMSAFGLFFNAVMPQFEAMTLTALGSRANEYGRIRVWGSLGFLLVAGSYGALLDRWGNGMFVWLTLPLLAATLWAAALHRHDPGPERVPTPADAGHLWRRPGVRRFLIVALLMQVSFGPFYVFYTLHLQAHGHSGLAVGALWAIGVLVEIALFWVAPQWIARFGAERLLPLCLGVTAARWIVTALFADSFAWMALAQATHALGFAMFHACNMRLMSVYFPGQRAATGQSLLYGFSSGIGGVLGAGLAALAWEQASGTAAFGAAAIVALIAMAVYAGRRAPVPATAA